MQQPLRIDENHMYIQFYKRVLIIDKDLVKLTALKMRGSSGTLIWTLMVRGGYWLPTVMAQSPLIYGQFLQKSQERFLLKRLK